MPFVEIQIFICKESSGPTLAGMSLGGLAVCPVSLAEGKCVFSVIQLKG